jgi:hypothetical protein
VTVDAHCTGHKRLGLVDRSRANQSSSKGTLILENSSNSTTMSSIRDHYAKLVIRKHHEKLSRPDGPWRHGLPQCRAPSPQGPQKVPVKVGIIGAGAAGLYAALIIDSLADPRITYDILDANPMTDRKGGGRLYTFNFQGGGANDYFVSLFLLGVFE